MEEAPTAGTYDRPNGQAWEDYRHPSEIRTPTGAVMGSDHKRAGTTCTWPLMMPRAWPTPRSCLQRIATAPWRSCEQRWLTTQPWVCRSRACTQTTARLPQSRLRCGLRTTGSESSPHTRPYTPRTNGKAERFIQTCLREWAYARAYIIPTSAVALCSPGYMGTTGTGPTPALLVSRRSPDYAWSEITC
jgi:hypothetical protein